MKMTFIQLVYQCGSNSCYNISNITYLVFLNMLTSSLHINFFTLYVLNTYYSYKIMAENSKCNPCTSEFVSYTIKCKICQKLMHYSCAKVNLLVNYMFDVVAHYWYSDYCVDALAIMNTNDDQIVPMNAISNTPSNLDFYHLMLGYSYPYLYCSYIVNINYG